MKPEILTRYADRPLPRYTSYPTAPHFGADVDASVYREWLADLRTGDAVSLYLHVPFCRSMCWYCGCHTTNGVLRRLFEKASPVERTVDVRIEQYEQILIEIVRGSSFH